MSNGYKRHEDMRGTDILARCRYQVREARNLRDRLVQTSPRDPFIGVLNTYNEMLVYLDSAMSQSSLLFHVHPQEKVRADAELCEQEASRFVTELSLDRDVYQVLERGTRVSLDEESGRLLRHTLRDFRRSGVDKSAETRRKIKWLKEQLVRVGQDFGQNIRDERFTIRLQSVRDLDGLPADYIQNHQPGPDGTIEISTDYPDYLPFMKYAKSKKYRQQLRHLFLNRGQKNGTVLRQMIERRHELAGLLDYRSYADYIVEDKMIKDSKEIHKFIENISKMAKKGADKEYRELVDFKKRWDSRARTIEGYESAYIEEAYKKEKFNFDSQSVRPYFSYPQVRDGLMEVTSKLFGVRYERIRDAEVWHQDVATYDVYDETGKLGRIYLDMHPREGKYKHAAQFTVRSGLVGRQYPEGALVTNFPNPKDGSALMEHRQVVTMFHEFGHLLHHVFAGKQRWMPFSGVATEWDFVEAPSQFLEEWAWDYDVLRLFARHYQTGQVISKDLVSRMRAADEFGKAISARQQMFYAKLSADYYDKDPQKLDLLGHLKDLQAKYSHYPYEEGTHFHYGFGHLHGYSAMYYTYMWSLSIAKDLLEPFRRTGLMNRETAQRFKKYILKPGGSKDARELVRDFLGRSYNLRAFEKWLTTDPTAYNSRRGR